MPGEGTTGAHPDATDLSGLAAAHDRLRRHLVGLLDAGFLHDELMRGPSLLEGWTRGHVMTHLARNADSVTRALAGAARGEVVDRYPGPPGTRDREIDEGAARPAAELVADVVDSSRALDEVLASMPAVAWGGSCRGRGGRGEEPVASLPLLRWREVELHQADLDLPGFEVGDWSDGLVEREADRLGHDALDRASIARANGRPGPDPAAWTAATLDPGWRRPFTTAEIDALDRALRAYEQASGGLDLGPDSGRWFPTDGLDELVADLRHRLIEGAGWPPSRASRSTATPPPSSG